MTHDDQGGILTRTDPYATDAISTRTGSTFGVHAYPTRINEKAIVPFILAHTRPGDLVFDGFAGSGSTGLAAAMCRTYKPSENGGARKFVLYDIGSLPSFIARTLLTPVDPTELSRGIRAIQETLASELGWIYQAAGPDGRAGETRFVVWSEEVICLHCGGQVRYIDAFLQWNPLEIRRCGECPRCGAELDSRRCERVTEEHYDRLLGRPVEMRLRRPSLVYGRSGKATWRRPAQGQDLDLIERIDSIALPTTVPVVPMLNSSSERWGELHRAGYHTGITHLHHFYTRRNLLVIARAWELAAELPEGLRDWAQMWISSYNTSHSTLMTRVVAKRGARDLVPTSAQSGALYVSSLPVERNVIAGLRTKARAISQAAAEVWSVRPAGRVVRGSSLRLHLGDESVDYIFTDPPFGDNIQYSETNFIAEAWLAAPATEQTEEAIVSKYQGKSAADYSALLAAAFAESRRVLKPGRFMTVVFHASSVAVWNALLDALAAAGFRIVRTTRLLKSQASFKQTTTRGFVRGDCVILTQKPDRSSAARMPSEATPGRDVWRLIEDRLDALPPASDERLGHRLHSWLVAESLGAGERVPLSAPQFYRELAARYPQENERHFLQGRT